MRKIPGIAAAIPKNEILTKDFQTISAVHDTAVKLTSKHGKLFCIELTFSGFDDDPRAVFEIPEIVEWAKTAQDRLPDCLYWLTPGALLRHLLCLNPSLYKKLPDGRLELNLDAKEIATMAAKSSMLAYSNLKNAGMAADSITKATIEASQNLQKALSGDIESTEIISETELEKNKGCFIATACFESESCAEVMILRQFRDEKLLQYRIGELFVKSYYRYSPWLANFLLSKPKTRKFIRVHLLNPIIRLIENSNRICSN